MLWEWDVTISLHNFNNSREKRFLVSLQVTTLNSWQKKIGENDLKITLAELETAPDFTVQDFHVSRCAFVSDATL
jgi:hypothetical protein